MSVFEELADKAQWQDEKIERLRTMFGGWSIRGVGLPVNSMEQYPACYAPTPGFAQAVEYANKAHEKLMADIATGGLAPMPSVGETHTYDRARGLVSRGTPTIGIDPSGRFSAVPKSFMVFDDLHPSLPITAADDPRKIDHAGPTDDVHRRARDVAEDLINRRIASPARRMLRDALDVADKPDPAVPKPFPSRALRFGAAERKNGWRPW